MELSTENPFIISKWAYHFLDGIKWRSRNTLRPSLRSKNIPQNGYLPPSIHGHQHGRCLPSLHNLVVHRTHTPLPPSRSNGGPRGGNLHAPPHSFSLRLRTSPMHIQIPANAIHRRSARDLLIRAVDSSRGNRLLSYL